MITSTVLLPLQAHLNVSYSVAIATDCIGSREVSAVLTDDDGEQPCTWAMPGQGSHTQSHPLPHPCYRPPLT